MTNGISVKDLMSLGFNKELAVALMQVLSRISEIQTEASEKQLLLEAEKTNAAKIQQANSELQKTISGLQTEIDDLKTRSAAKETINVQMRQMIASIKEQLAKKDQKITELEKVLEAEKSAEKSDIGEKDKSAEALPKNHEPDTNSGVLAGTKDLDPLSAIKILAREELEKINVSQIDIAEQMIGFLINGEEIKVVDLQQKIGCGTDEADGAARGLIDIGLAKENRRRSLLTIQLKDKIKKLIEEKGDTTSILNKDKPEELNTETEKPFGAGNSYPESEVETNPINISIEELEPLIKSLGITSGNKEKILVSILKHPGATIKEISEDTGISGNNIFSFSNPLLLKKGGLGLIVKKQKSPDNKLVKAFWPVKNVVQKMRELAEKVKPEIPQSELGQENSNIVNADSQLLAGLANLIEKKSTEMAKNWRSDKIRNLTRLLSFMLKNDGAPVTVDAIIDRFGCSPQTPLNWMKDLNSIGIVSIEHGKINGKGNERVIFELVKEAVPEFLTIEKKTPETEKTEKQKLAGEHPDNDENTEKLLEGKTGSQTSAEPSKNANQLLELPDDSGSKPVKNTENDRAPKTTTAKTNYKKVLTGEMLSPFRIAESIINECTEKNLCIRDFWGAAKDKGISDDNNGRKLMEKALHFLKKRGTIELARADPFWENSLIVKK